MRFVTILFFLINLFFSLPVYAATYYISPTGNDSTGKGTIDNPWLTLKKGTSVLAAGDTLYVRGGTYAKVDDYSTCSASGTSGSPITIKNYAGETPVFRTRARNDAESYVLTFSGSYWIIDGLQFRPTDISSCSYAKHCFYLTTGHHNTFRNIYVESVELPGSHYTFGQIFVVLTDYNEVYNCTLLKAGDFSSYVGQSGSVVLIVGSHNKVHNNNLSYGCHDVIGLYSGTGYTCEYNEIYDNTITHALGYGIYPGAGQYNLIQDNNITGCNEAPISYVKNPIYVKAPRNIIRRNVGWNNLSYGYCQDGTSAAGNHVYNNVFYNSSRDGIYVTMAGGITAIGNKFYNNVIAHNMQNTSWDRYYAEMTDHSTVSFWAATYNNEFKNNFFVSYVGGVWQNNYANCYFDIYGEYNKKTASWVGANYTTWSNNIYNYCDLKFVDPTKGDFHIQSGSCLIDAGRHLTTANGSGSNSTTLIVYDAGFFWPGDIIKIGSVTATISSINYATNTITLSSPKIWNHVDNVDLDYKGIAPDIGAFEYVFNLAPTPPSPPINLRVVP